MEFEEEDNEVWDKPVDETTGNVSPYKLATSTTSVNKDDHSRVILHIDIDCFYAQVEMIRNPELFNKPLGIQQKNIVVTCNYPARERGVTKLMYLKDARERCPELILVSGEDLTKYREMSYKISEFLQRFCPLVERLGFDENFLDITSLVTDRLAGMEPQDVTEVKGHVYGQELISASDSCGCGCHRRLSVGSQLAADMRAGLQQELGITCCGGVAHNKLLSKLVAGTHKPNQQTTLFPELKSHLMSKLTTVRNIPGIGSSTSKRLKEIGIVSVQDVHEADLVHLERELGAATANSIRQLCAGIDNTPVVPYGLPQTMSVEDSMKSCCTMSEVKLRVHQLLTSLLKRLLKDGRTPHTLRLTVRNRIKSFTKESRQCTIPPTVFTRFTNDTLPRVSSQLEALAVELFTKMVDPKHAFHLTLINVAFAKLEQQSGGRITEFFSQRCNQSSTSTAKPEDQSNSQLSSSTAAAAMASSNITYTDLENTPSKPGSAKEEPRKQGLLKWFAKSTSSQLDCLDTVPGNIEGNKDGNVLTSPQKHGVSKPTEYTSSKGKNLKESASFFKGVKRKASTSPARCHKMPGNANSKSENTEIPDGIDTAVFNELPPEIQKEILAGATSTITDKVGQESTSTDTNGEESIERPEMTTQAFPNQDRTRVTNLAIHGESVVETLENDKKTVCTKSSTDVPADIFVPPGVDKSVFSSLPKEIQDDLISQWKTQTRSKSSPTSQKISSEKKPKTSNILSFFHKKDRA